MKYSKDDLFLIWLDSFSGFEYKHKAYLYDKYKSYDCQSLTEFINDNKSYFMESVHENAYNTLIQSCSKDYLAYILNGLYKKGVDFITLASENYPKEFLDTPCPPIIIYYSGNINLLSNQKFTIVGSRKSLPFSISKATEIANDLIDNGLTIVTGIAEGVETQVIKSSLKSGKIISVLAGGFNNVYPKSNANLVEELKDCGLVISEYPPDTPTEPFHYYARNRLLAALGKGVLVVSGGIKSGTAITANYALDYGKDIFALPYSVNVSSGEGCNELLKQGAILTTSSDDIFRVYSIEKKEEKKIELTPLQIEVYEIIKKENVHIDKLCALTGKKVNELMPVLMILEIKKLIIKNAGNIFCAV